MISAYMSIKYIKPLFKAKGVPDEELLLAELIQVQEDAGGVAIQGHYKQCNGDATSFCAVGCLRHSRHGRLKGAGGGSIVVGNDSPRSDHPGRYPPFVDLGRAFQDACGKSKR